jgi:hypothetical protein
LDAQNEHLKRRAIKRANTTPKSVYEAVKPLGAAQFKETKTQEAPLETRYAKCKRLATRTVVVGSTPFSFDVDGICKVEMKPGRAALPGDYAQLLKMNGVSEQGAQNEPAAAAPAPAPAPEPTPEPTPAPAAEPVEAAPEEPAADASSDPAEEETSTRRKRRRKAKKEND